MRYRLEHLIAASLAIGSLAFILGVSSARAADLGKPSTIEQIAAAKPYSPLAGCYGEISAAGQFLAAGDREAQGTLGHGCTVRTIGVVIVGGGARMDLGNAVNSGSIYGRLGMALNPHLDWYGLAEWKTPNWHLTSTGQLYLGAGLETNLFKDNVVGFIEGSHAIATIGSASRDDTLIRAGVRLLIK